MFSLAMSFIAHIRCSLAYTILAVDFTDTINLTYILRFCMLSREAMLGICLYQGSTSHGVQFSLPALPRFLLVHLTCTHWRLASDRAP